MSESASISNNNSSSSSPSLIVTVRWNESVRFTIPAADSGDTIRADSTILQIKTMIAKEESCGNCSVDRQRLIYKGRILSDDSRTLADYGLSCSNQTIHLVKGRSDNNNNNNSPPTATTSPPSTNTTPSAPFNPFLMMQQQANTNTNNTNIPSLPNMEEMQQQLLRNPEAMSNMMNSPTMQSILNNPDVIRDAMEANPEMARVMDNNPQMRAVLEDPELMRRSMEAMRDPSAMQNMMRNQELAMSQIENLPGGFNALRRMYEDVQEPMMDAMSGMGGSGSAGSGTSTNSGTNDGSTTNAGAGGTAMPNPWGSPVARTTPTAPSTTTNNPWASNPLFNANDNTNNNATMPTGAPNLEQTISMLENPVINNMMQQFMSDPATMQQMLDSNPMMRQMRQSNPAVASIMSNPETMRAMMDPNNLRAMANLQQAMGGTAGMGGTANMANLQQAMSGVANTTSTGYPSTPTDNTGLDFSSLLTQFQSTNVSSSSVVPPTNTTTPEQRFTRQLDTLHDMGFTDRAANIRALTASGGNVNRAVEMLLSEI